MFSTNKYRSVRLASQFVLDHFLVLNFMQLQANYLIKISIQMLSILNILVIIFFTLWWLKTGATSGFKESWVEIRINSFIFKWLL